MWKGADYLKPVKIACVGEATAKALKSKGIRVDMVPDDYKQEGLARAFGMLIVGGKKILLLGAKEGRDLLAKALKEKGAKVDSLPLYENCAPPNARPQLKKLFSKEGGVDLVIFASSSAANNFYGLFPPAQRRLIQEVPVAVIGPVTASTVRKWGGKIVVQPSMYTLSALVSAIERRFGRRI